MQHIILFHPQLFHYAAGLVVPEGFGMFGFLLSDELPVDNLPPGLVGCVTDVRVDGDDLTLLELTFEEVLEGFCPSA